MQSAQESLAELRAAIRYCENAISAAESTIESMDFRQQLARQKSTEREQALSEDIDILILENTKLKLEAKNWNFDNTNLQEANDHLEACVAELKAENTKLLEDKEREQALDDELEKPTMPVIPRNVAIAIFREGQRLGYNNKSVAENLKGLCENLNFECRIHGIDDIEKS